MVVVEIVSCNITLNWDDSWWLMSDEHLKPVGNQSLGCHVGWLEARIVARQQRGTRGLGATLHTALELGRRWLLSRTR